MRELIRTFEDAAPLVTRVLEKWDELPECPGKETLTPLDFPEYWRNMLDYRRRERAAYLMGFQDEEEIRYFLTTCGLLKGLFYNNHPANLLDTLLKVGVKPIDLIGDREHRGLKVWPRLTREQQVKLIIAAHEHTTFMNCPF